MRYKNMAISATLAALFFNLIPASYAATPVVNILKSNCLSGALSQNYAEIEFNCAISASLSSII